MSDTATLYRSDSRPVFEPFTIQPPAVQGFRYRGDLASELRDGRLDAAAAVDLLDDMLTIREFEEMIVRLRSGAYEPLRGLRLPRAHPRLHRPGGHGRRRLLRLWPTRPHHHLPSRPRRQHRQGLRRPSAP